MSATLKLKRRVFAAFCGTCQICGKVHETSHDIVSTMRVALTKRADGTIPNEQYDALLRAMSDLPCVDRIIPGKRGGRYEPTNVTLLCRPCNSRKRDRDGFHLKSLAEVEASP